MADEGRLTQTVSEVLFSPDPPPVRMTQTVSEVLFTAVNQAILTQTVAEILYTPPLGGGGGGTSRTIAAIVM